jgi:hypothetical protein
VVEASRVGVLLAADAALAQSPIAPGDVTVFTAKKIITMDPGWPEATAVAVQGRRILSVGSLDELPLWLRKGSPQDRPAIRAEHHPSRFGRAEFPSADRRNVADAAAAHLFPDARSFRAALPGAPGRSPTSSCSAQTVVPSAIRDIAVIATVLGGRVIPTESTKTPPH